MTKDCLVRMATKATQVRPESKDSPVKLDELVQQEFKENQERMDQM